MIPGAGDACSVSALRNFKARGPGLVEARVGVLSFCHSMPLCAKSECCDALGGFPLHRRAWNSVTMKQGLAATGDF